MQREKVIFDTDIGGRSRWNPFDAAVAWGGAALAMFVLAALAWPGGGYNPFCGC